MDNTNYGCKCEQCTVALGTKPSYRSIEARNEQLKARIRKLEEELAYATKPLKYNKVC